MKDQVPIKGHQAIVSFSKGHHFGLALENINRPD
jgi:hypothetical protein